MSLNPGVTFLCLQDVHPYISTGLGETKFGVELDGLAPLLEKIRDEPFVQLVGLHCHLGSTIDNTRVFRSAAVQIKAVVSEMEDRLIERLIRNFSFSCNYGEFTICSLTLYL